MDDTIEAHYSRAYSLARSKVEKMARKILKDHPNLESFVMAMGGVMFTLKANVRHRELGLEDRKYFAPLRHFIYEWDEFLHLTGDPMWIEGPDGEIKTDW